MTVSVNCTTINMDFNPQKKETNQLFSFDPILYVCKAETGDDKDPCGFEAWMMESSQGPQYKEIPNAIQMRR